MNHGRGPRLELREFSYRFCGTSSHGVFEQSSYQDQRDDDRGGVKVQPAKGEGVWEENVDEAVKVRCGGSNGDQEIHVRGSHLDCVVCTHVEPPPRYELDRGGES